MKNKLSKLFIAAIALLLMALNCGVISAHENEEETMPASLVVSKNRHLIKFSTEELENGFYADLECYEVEEPQAKGLITRRKTLETSYTIYKMVNGNKKPQVKFVLEGTFSYTGTFSDCEAAYAKAIKYTNFRASSSSKKSGSTAYGYFNATDNNTSQTYSKTLRISVDPDGSVTY